MEDEGKEEPPQNPEFEVPPQLNSLGSLQSIESMNP